MSAIVFQFGVDSPEETFESLQALIVRANAEAELWSTAVAGASSNARSNPRGVEILRGVANHWTGAAEAFQLAASESKQNSLQQVLSQRTAITERNRFLGSRSPLGRAVLGIAAQDMEAAGWLVGLMDGTAARAIGGRHEGDVVQLCSALSRRLLQNAGQAPADAVAGEHARAAAAKAEDSAAAADMLRAKIQDLYGEMQESRAADVESVQQVLRDLKTAADEQRGTISKEWTADRNALLKDAAFGAPRAFWDAKKLAHRNLAALWAAVFVAVAVVALIVPGYVAPSIARTLAAGVLSPRILDQGRPTDDQPSRDLSWLIPAISLGVPFFLTLWMARFSARQVGEHLMRREDADERATMIRTYLALTSRKAGVPADAASTLQLLLPAIFRPGPGLGSDDSPPVNLIDALSRFAGFRPPR